MKRNVGAASAWLLSCSLLAIASQPATAQNAPVGAAPATGTSAAPGATAAPAAPGAAAAPATGTTPGAATTTGTAAAPAAPAAPTPPPTWLGSLNPLPADTWAGGIKLNAQFEAGAIINPENPSNGINFGQLFTDRSNQFVMNQALITLQRPTDPKATDYDFGFKIQALYGTDARYTQFLGELNYAFASRYQLAFPEASVSAHLPWLFEGGIDAKAGQFPTPLGYETIDPSTNPFYSHSYIFNFGLPFVSFGGLAVSHVNSTVDVYLGVDSGSNTTVGWGDNNTAAAGTVGFNLTFLGGNLTILALTHFGPENPSKTVPNADSYYRYFNDAVITYKASDTLTLTTEANLVRDDYGIGTGAANGFGAAQYVSYALNDNVTLNGRAEVYRDDNGFFVAGFTGSHSFVNAQLGVTPPIGVSSGVVSVGPATYSEITLGLTWKPTLPDALNTTVSALMVRPEVRYDYALTNTKAYNNGSDRGAFTFGADFVLSF